MAGPSPVAGMTDDQLNRYFSRPDFDSSILTQEEKQRLVKLTAPKPTTGTEAIAAAEPDNPMNFARDFTKGVGGQLKDQFGGLVEGAKALPDVLRGFADPSTRDATASGMKSGAGEGILGMKSMVTDPVALATGIGKQPEDTNLATKIGRLAAGAATVGVPAVLGDRVMNGPPKPEPILPEVRRVAEGFGTPQPPSREEIETVAKGFGTPPPGKLNPTPRLTLEDHLIKALNEARMPEKPGAVFMPPSQENPFPPMRGRGVPENTFQPRGKVEIVEPPKAAKPPKVVAKKPESPVEAVGPTAATPATPAPAVTPAQPSNEEILAGLPPERQAEVQQATGGGPINWGPAPDRGLGKMSQQDIMFESLMDQLHGDETQPGRLTGRPTDASDLAPKPGMEGAFANPHSDQKMTLRQSEGSLLNRLMSERGSVSVGPDWIFGKKIKGKSPNLAEIRDEVGAADAARNPRFVKAMKAAGGKPTREAVQDITGTPSRRPSKFDRTMLDNDFLRKMMDPKGSAQIFPDSWFSKKTGASPKTVGSVDLSTEPSAGDKASFLGEGPEKPVGESGESLMDSLKSERGSFSPKDLVGGANQLRVMSMLSGLAVPKSILGNASAIGTAALEGGTTAPLRELGNVPANLKSLKDAWKSTANPAAIAGAGRINLPGRVMGAADQATIDLLKRAGLPEDEAQRLQLQRPNPIGDNNFGKRLKSTAGRAMWPFQRTPFNQLAEGLSPENWHDPSSTAGTARRTALSLGTAGAGYELGQNTKDPKLLGLAAALAGPRGIPLLMGAAMGGAGRNAIAGISPIPEWGIPSKWSDLIRLSGIEPAAVKAYGLDDAGKRNPTRKSRTAPNRATRK